MKTGLTLDELRETAEFQRMTGKQKKFVETYITNGYKLVPAIREAYVCKNDVTANVMSYSVMNSLNVTFCLALHFGEKPIDTFKKHMSRLILRNRITKTQVQAWELYARINGWSVRLQRKDFGTNVPQNARQNPGQPKAKTEKQNFNLDEFEKPTN